MARRFARILCWQFSEHFSQIIPTNRAKRRLHHRCQTLAFAWRERVHSNVTSASPRSAFSHQLLGAFRFRHDFANHAFPFFLSSSAYEGDDRMRIHEIIRARHKRRARGARVPCPVFAKSQTQRNATANPMTDGKAASHRHRAAPAVSMVKPSHTGSSNQNQKAKNPAPTANDARRIGQSPS